MPFARLILAASLLLSTSALASADELFDACAAAAANPFEPGYEDIAPPLDRFYAYAAIEACMPALAQDASNAQLMAWLGNAYAADNEAGKGVPLLEPAAAAGNMLAQRALGDLLILGKGIAQDKIRGVDLLHQSAEQGFAPAALSLGYSFEFGDGVTVDPAAAMSWYVKAAEAGLVRAQLIVARHYQQGNGVPVDDAEALRWLMHAADANNAEGQYLLGLAFLEGRGTPQNYRDAQASLQLSVDNYSAEGSTALGYMTELGLGTDADPEKAASLYWTGRSGNVVIAKHNLARLEEDGLTQGSPEEARQLYEEAARAGELRAAVNLALMLLEGKGGPQDIAGAFTWTERAAKGGNAAGLNNLGRMYELGLGVDASADEARRLYQQAAALGYELASENLSRLGG